MNLCLLSIFIFFGFEIKFTRDLGCYAFEMLEVSFGYQLYAMKRTMRITATTMTPSTISIHLF